MSDEKADKLLPSGGLQKERCFRTPGRILLVIAEARSHSDFTKRQAEHHGNGHLGAIVK